MKLRCVASSSTASSLCLELSNILNTSLGRAYRPRDTFIKTTKSVIADFLSSASAKIDRFSYRFMDSKTFTDCPVGYTSFKAVFDGLCKLRYLDVERGYKGRVDGGGFQGRATRLRARPALFEQALAYGITPGNWREHFKPRARPPQVRNPVILKSSSRMEKGKRIESNSMLFDYNHPKVARASHQVQELNRYFAGVSIEPDEHFGFQRIFNQGDDLAFDWNRGGRLYSIGGGYQMMEKELRSSIRIRDEATVEVDITGSFPTILHSLLGWHFLGTDPYTALPEIPRNVTKAWVNMALGHDGFQSRWSATARRKYSEDDRYALQREWPLKTVRDRLRPAMPIMDAWLASDIRWGTLQYAESEIIIGTVWELAMTHDVPALPVYDSIIVPTSKRALAEQVLSDAFHRQTGIRPLLKFK